MRIVAGRTSCPSGSMPTSTIPSTYGHGTTIGPFPSVGSMIVEIVFGMSATARHIMRRCRLKYSSCVY
eukprot:3808169-Pyramimonas_sp.AAC.1